MMGCFCLTGQGGIEKAEAKAIEWFLRSASQEFPLALFQVGMCSYRGQLGFSQSDEEAYKFFSLAAKKRMPQADYFLGVMYEFGRGVQISLKHAKKHYKIADEFGIHDAKFRLANILFQEEQKVLGSNYLSQRIHIFAVELFEELWEFVSKIYSTIKQGVYLKSTRPFCVSFDVNLKKEGVA